MPYFFVVLLLGVAALFQCSFPPPLPSEKHEDTFVLPPALKAAFLKNSFPSNILAGDKHLHIHYTFDSILQKDMENLLQSYRPDYGAILALEPETGRILASVSYSRFPLEKSMLLQATFPAASLYKFVTAAMAIEIKKASSETLYPIRGTYHTLYKKNVTHRDPSGHQISLKDAFAHSINSVFGKIGYFELNQSDFKTYSERFLFNTDISTEIPVEKGEVVFEQDNDRWELAEIGSGYNQKVRLSPLQAALIASSIPNAGVIYSPHYIDAIYENSTPVHLLEPQVLSKAIQGETAQEMKKLLRETVAHGTSRSAFRDLMRQPFFKECDLGGKTGSLSGTNPKGKYDWFIGYATYQKKSIALATLTINEDFWRVKASYLARRLLEKFFEAEKQSFAKTKKERQVAHHR